MPSLEVWKVVIEAGDGLEGDPRRWSGGLIVDKQTDDGMAAWETAWGLFGIARVKARVFMRNLEVRAGEFEWAASSRSGTRDSVGRGPGWM